MNSSRQIAREAVIFALVGMLLAAFCGIVFLSKGARSAARTEAATSLHGSDMASTFIPDHSVRVPLSDGTVLFVVDCNQDINLSDGLVPPPPIGSMTEKCVFFPRNTGKVSVRIGDAVQIALERRYWENYFASRNNHLEDDVFPEIILGLIGFPAGLAIWIFYRTVRFAVKG